MPKLMGKFFLINMRLDLMMKVTFMINRYRTMFSSCKVEFHPTEANDWDEDDDD